MLWVRIFCTDVCIKGFPNVPRGNLGIADQARMWTHPTANRTYPTLEPPFFTPRQFSACFHGHLLRRSVQRRASVAIQTAALPARRQSRPFTANSRTLRPSTRRSHPSANPSPQRQGMRRRANWVNLADELGVDRSYISDMERGEKNVCLPTMEIIAIGFGVSISKLVSRL
jgi:transcriptional regulator with XRE-family HTH domain